MSKGDKGGLDEYFERSGLSPHLNSLVATLLEHRPEYPIEFMSNFFDAAQHVQTPRMRAFRQIQLVPHDRATFLENLTKAYECFHKDIFRWICWNRFYPSCRRISQL
eukprot:Rmarinus@m.177